MKPGPKSTGNNTLPVLGITKIQSSRWQRIAKVAGKPGNQSVTNHGSLLAHFAAQWRAFGLLLVCWWNAVESLWD